jgi:hypothetical protein
MSLSTHDWGMLAAGGGLVLALAYYAYSSTGDTITPEVQTEAQFKGLGLDVGGRVNVGSNLSLDPLIHFWHPGLDPEPGAQKTRTLPIKYPYVSGANLSTLIHRGFDAMKNGSPDNHWRDFPPSEVSL